MTYLFSVSYVLDSCPDIASVMDFMICLFSVSYVLDSCPDIASLMDFMTNLFSVSYVLDACPGSTQTVFRADQTEVVSGVTAGFTDPPPGYQVDGAFDLSVPGSGVTISNEVPAGVMVRNIAFNIRIDDFAQDSTIMTILDNSSPPRGLTVKLENSQLVIDLTFPPSTNLAEEAVVTYTQAQLGGDWNSIRLTLFFPANGDAEFLAGLNDPLVKIAPTVGPDAFSSFPSGDIVISQFAGALSCITIDNLGNISPNNFQNSECIFYTRKFELLIF